MPAPRHRTGHFFYEWSVIPYQNPSNPRRQQIQIAADPVRGFPKGGAPVHRRLRWLGLGPPGKTKIKI